MNEEILCLTCSHPKDYGNGWVYCPMRHIWLKKGYKKCKAHNEGERPQVLHTGADPSIFFQRSGAKSP